MLIKFLLPVLFLTAFLRFYLLDQIPPSLNWDEVSIGYNSYSILKTGSDEWGEFLPLSFRAYGDYKLPGYVYLDIPFIATFGLNEWGVRAPSAILGVGFVFLIFLILRNLVGSRVALWGSLIAAILPWTLIISRIALEAHLALFLTTLGFYLFLLGLKEKKFLYFSSICFGLTIFSYNSSRVVTPLLVAAFSLVYLNDLKKYKKIAFLSLLIFLVFFSVALPKALLQDSSARYRWTAVVDEGAINRINEQRGLSKLPPLLNRAKNNKVVFVITESSKNYISHFNPNFLFLNGGSNYQFSVPGSGLLYPVLIPFLFLGIWQYITQRKKWQVLTLIWLLSAPLPAAITRDSPHALRSLMLIPPIIFLCASGIDQLSTIFRKKVQIVSVILLFSLFLSLFYFWKNYSGDYIKNYSWSFQYGYQEAIDYTKLYGAGYEKIYFSKKYGEPHEFVLFYLKYDPDKYNHDSNLERYHKSDWYWVDSFDKFVFLNDWEVKEKAECINKCLLVTSPGNYPEGSMLLKEINFLDGQKAFDIVELPQVQ
jgi:hypothetical protein